MPAPADATTSTYFPHSGTQSADATNGGRWLSSGGMLGDTQSPERLRCHPLSPSPGSPVLSRLEGTNASVAPSLSLSQAPSLCATAATWQSGSGASVLSQGIVGSPLHSVPSVRANGKPVMTLTAEVGTTGTDATRKFGIVCLVPRQPAAVATSPVRRAVAQEANL